MFRKETTYISQSSLISSHHADKRPRIQILQEPHPGTPRRLHKRPHRPRDNKPAFGPRQSDVQSPSVREEPDLALRVVAHRAEHDHVLFASFESVDRLHLHVAYLERTTAPERVGPPVACGVVVEQFFEECDLGRVRRDDPDVSPRQVL